MSTDEPELRKHLVAAMSGHETHIDFDSVVRGFPPDRRGLKPSGAPHSAWQLLEHMRIAQHDILEFSRDPSYVSPDWPAGYWPETGAPPDEKAWEDSVKQFKRDACELEELVEDQRRDLLEPFAHGEGQTLLREALLVATHNSYHLGQLMLLQKMQAGGA
jgi:hypothetical protein